MKTSLDGRVVVIVGASSGIGRAAAARFAQQGATVVCAARGKRSLDATVSEIANAGGRAYAVPTNAAERGQVDALARQAVDTPMFVHARSRLGTRPGPIPPVYDPDVVAAAIVRAAQRPTREVVVGGAGAAYATLQRLAPALSDAAAGLLWRLQHDDRADDAHDNLDEPLDGAGAVRGGWTGHVSQTSAYTALVGQRPWATRALVTGAGLLAYRRIRRCS